MFAACWLLLGTAFGHGGVPEATEVVPVAGDVAVISTHGLLVQEQPGDWRWICEEITGTAYRSGLVRTASGDWVLSTTQGALTSSDGCDWQPSGGLDGTYVSQLALDRADPDRVWASTYEGLWLSTDGGRQFTLTLPVDASVRSFAQTEDGDFYLFVFEDDGAAVWFGRDTFLSTPLEGTAGQLLALGTDDRGRALAHFPAGAADTLLRIDPEGQVETLLELDVHLKGLDLDGDTLDVAVTGEGTIRSVDDGQTWTVPDGLPLNCLKTVQGTAFACPDDDLGADALYQGDGSNWQIALSFDQIGGPLTCPVDSTVQTVCAPLWPAVSKQFGVPFHGGVEAVSWPVEGGSEAGDPSMPATGEAPAACATGGPVSRFWPLIWLALWRRRRGAVRPRRWPRA